MAQVPFSTAQSNLATYAAALHWDAVARALPANIDRWVTFGGLLAFVGAGLFLAYFRRPKPSKVGEILDAIKAEKEPKQAPARFYSQKQKERLADLYDEMTQILLVNGANGGGTGAYFALANLYNIWSRQRDEWHNKHLDGDLLEVALQVANDSLAAFYATFYIGNSIRQRPEHLAYADEIAAVLDDATHGKILTMQTRLNEFRHTVLSVLEAQKTDNRRLLEMVITSSVGPTNSYQIAFTDFQKWLFDANARAIEARNALG